MTAPLRLVFLGLSISSSWGNGHATTYRALIRALAVRGHDVLFLERDVPWYAENRDAPSPQGCRLELYASLEELQGRFAAEVAAADAVIVGSYVPDGADVVRWVLGTARGLRLFYDIDTPVTLEKLRRQEPTYIAPDSIPELDAYLSFTGGPVLDTIVRVFKAKVCLPLYCSVDTEIYAPVASAKDRDLGYLGTYSADRQAALDELLVQSARRLPDRRFVVAGSSYPVTKWPENVERIEHVSPGDHAAFYGSLRFALNLTRADMLKTGHSPSVRIFEAAACGVPVVSDAWTGIEEFFEPGKEIVVATSSAEVLQLLTCMPEEERMRIGERARQRVVREHAAVHRALELEQHLAELGAEGRGASRPARAATARTRRCSSEYPAAPELSGDLGQSAAWTEE